MTTTSVDSEWVDSDRFSGPKMKRITFECGKCGHRWVRTLKAEPKRDPPCPNRRCVETSQIADLKRENENLRQMLEEGRAPAMIGQNIRVKAVDETARIVMGDGHYTDLRDNIREGESMEPKLPQAQQALADAMFSNKADQRFVIGLLVAFLPAVVVGLIAGSYIKSTLFNPWVVCFSLIVGGAILLWVDQLDLKPHEHDATNFPLPMYVSIGFAQCLAMIPGVSRSGASIVAAMLFGADKHAAAEFSFFLAIPTMVGAFAYDFYKNRAEMTTDHLGIIAIGFVVSFITALVVVKTFLSYVTRHGFNLFAWWRVIVGTLGLIALALGR